MTVPFFASRQVSAKATSSTTVVVTWGPVPRAHRGGILEGYRVVYRAAKEAEPTRKHIESNATFTTTLTELRKHTSYTVQVREAAERGARAFGPYVGGPTSVAARYKLPLTERARVAFLDGSSANVSQEHSLSAMKRYSRTRKMRNHWIVSANRPGKALIVCYEPSAVAK